MSSTSTIFSKTAVGQTVQLDCNNVGTVSVQMVATSLVGHNASFEVSNDSVVWVPIMGARTNSSTVCETSTGVLAATPAYGWEFGVGAWAYFRVRTTAHTSGTAKYLVVGSAGSIEPCTSVPTAVTVSGTVTANVGTQPTMTPIAITSLAGTNAAFIKASAATLYMLAVSNVGGSAAFLKLYNKASAPVVASDIPALVIPVAAGSCVSLNLGKFGHRFATGLAYVITGAVGNTDATAVAANQVQIIGDYT